jgi:hypothetical protein
LLEVTYSTGSVAVLYFWTYWACWADMLIDVGRFLLEVGDGAVGCGRRAVKVVMRG